MALPVAIAAATEIRPGRYPDKLGDAMYFEVLRSFLDEWSLRPQQIGGLLASPSGMAAGAAENIFVHEVLCEELGICPAFAQTMNAGGSTYAVMVARAVTAIRQGVTDSVLCIGAGTFPKVRDSAEKNARMASHPDFDYLYGTFIPPLYAQAATRHMHDHGTTKAQLAAVAVGQREWALRHPDALMRSKGALTIEQVLESKPIASPFNLLDCSVPCDGGGAVLVTDARLAREINPRPAWVLGCGEAHNHHNISQARDLWNLGGHTAMQQALARADRQPQDLDFLQLYDSFSFNPILGVENAGVVERGRGGEFFAAGRGAPGGDLPVNTYGGLLSFGHTGDASGMSMVVEGALQIMQRAGERQLTRSATGLVHCYGGMMGEHAALVLGETP